MSSELHEPAIILDTFARGPGRSKEISPGLFRLSYYAVQRGYDGSPERVCVAEFIMAAETMVELALDAGRQEEGASWSHMLA